MNKKYLKNTEWSILICTIILISIGLLALYSASKSSELGDLKKQVLWVIISIPVLIITTLVDYKIIAKLSIGFYILSIILLIAVLLTSAINGATSWFNIGTISIQPAELAKIAVVLFLANIMSKMSKEEINKPIKLAMILGIVLLPYSFKTRLWNSNGIYCCNSCNAICIRNKKEIYNNSIFISNNSCANIILFCTARAC